MDNRTGSRQVLRLAWAYMPDFIEQGKGSQATSNESCLIHKFQGPEATA